MAQFCIEIPDDKINEVLGAIAHQYRYQAQVDNPSFNSSLAESVDNPRLIQNPENIAQFVNRMTRQWLVENVKAHQAYVAAEMARQAALADFSLEIRDPQQG